MHKDLFCSKDKILSSIIQNLTVLEAMKPWYNDLVSRVLMSFYSQNDTAGINLHEHHKPKLFKTIVLNH